MKQASSLVRPRTVTGDGDGLVSHAGLVWLGKVADATGLTAGLRRAGRGLSWRKHHPGHTLGLLTLALADGATCVADFAGVRDQKLLFGEVASGPTAWRSFERCGPTQIAGIDTAVADGREIAWRADPDGDRQEQIIDIDATLVVTKADKQDARPTWKRTYGHHPLLAIDAERGEILAQLMGPGNAGSNTASDHVVVLGAAIDALPVREAVGHRPGDDPASVQVPTWVRADAGGATHWLAEECRHRNLGFSFGYFIDGRVRDALLLVQEEDWTPAIEPGNKIRAGAYVAELTKLVDLSSWPPGTRLIVRRERPHPGAQLSLFDDIEGWRHTAQITDRHDTAANVELAHRQRGRAETVIRDLKACGYTNLPFDCVVNNDIWARLCAAALNLMSWARHLTLTGPLRSATPKTIRYRLLHIAAPITPGGTKLDLDRNWPWTPTILEALDRLNTLIPPHTVTEPRAA